MRRLSILAVMLICLVSTFAFGADLFPDVEKSFRGLEWGASFERYKSVFVTPAYETEGDVTVYQRRNEHLRISGVAMDNVLYAFAHDTFLSVSLEFTGKKSWDTLISGLEAQFGKSDESTANFYIKKTGDINIVAKYEGAKGAIVIASNAAYQLYIIKINNE